MFDDFVRRLQSLNGITIPVEDTLDNEAEYQRRCPSDTCNACFGVRWIDWKDKVSDSAAYCPYCRCEAQAFEFNTPEQWGHFGTVGMKALEEYLNSSGRSLPRITMPAATDDILRQHIVCERCGCHFTVVGAGYFCPACGFNSADRTVDESIERVRVRIRSLSAVSASMSDTDGAAHLRQFILEGSLSNLVTAFQRFAETCYTRLPSPSSKPGLNAFQRISEGSALWREAGGRQYQDILSSPEFADLIRYVQQRHLLEHSQGIVDQRYLDRSGDTTYTLGQRIVVGDTDVLRLADIVSTLIAGMRADTSA